MTGTTALPIATEHWRPRYHFTPARNWINDPNGLVYFEGEYHLFYQYNPQGKQWGHMSWGHAVSSNLVDWTELPVAMPEREYMIFSGAAVVDWQNTSGLGDGSSPPLVALYTAFHEATERQVQHLAYSHDRGRSWIDHPANPVIDRQMEHFRDPKVFWHAKTSAWIMVVTLSREHKVAIYRSLNLVDWELSSEFGPFGRTSGQWECPDLIELPIEQEEGTIWMLKVDVDKDVIGSANGTQVFFGTFDGHRFTTDNTDGILADHGVDFYAAQSWSDLPDCHTTPIWIAWMSNHQSGHQYPTHPWRGAMTLPRSITAKRFGSDWRLIQRPVELPYNDEPMILLDLADRGASPITLEVAEPTGEIRIKCTRECKVAITIGPAQNFAGRLSIDGACRTIRLERRAVGWDAPDAFFEPMDAGWSADDVDIRIVMDRLSVEIFIPSEGVALSACIFAPEFSQSMTNKFGQCR